MKVNKTLVTGSLFLGVLGVASVFFFGGHISCKAEPDSSFFDVKILEKKTNIIPIAIIGSGPGGLSAAVYGARAKLHTVVLEGSKPGGLLTETTEVENWPGQISILGPDIVSNVKKHAQHVGAEFLADTVEEINFSQWPYVIKTEEGRTLHALSVIIATGATPRRLNVPGEKEYWGSGVTSCAICDAPFFKGEDVVVVGGGDSAVEEATQLSPYVKSVKILVRKDTMRAARSMQERLKGYANVSIMYNVEIKEIIGSDNKVTAVRLINHKTKKISDFPTAGVFLAVGHDPNTTLFKGQIDLVHDGYVGLKGRSQETSKRGVFSAGDVEDYVYRQAGVASGSGIKAALEASWFLSGIGFNPEIESKVKNNFFHINKSAVVKEVKRKSILSHDDFVSVVNPESGLVVLDFSAPWCPSCIRMLPLFHEVGNELKDKATFISIDVDEAPALSDELFVSKIPCILVYKKGTLVARYNQAMDKKQIKEFVGQFLDDK